MIGYKGFDKNFRCRDFQYEVGKTYHHDGEIAICDSGFHFCKNPNDIFSYYPPAGSRFALIEATGNIVEDDNKSCTDELTVVRELTLAELIAAVPDKHKSVATGDYSVATNTDTRSAAVNTGYYSAATNTGDWSVSANTGDWSAAVNTGYRSAAANTSYRSVSVTTGDWSAATNTGYQSVSANKGNSSVAVNTGNSSAAEVSGKNSVALVIGNGSCAKGALGCWLVLSEWRDNEIADVQVFKVDGEHIKPDTFYTLKDGKATEVQS